MAMPAVRPALKAGLFLAFLAAFTAAYFNHWPIPYLASRLAAFGVAGLVFWAVHGRGKMIVNRASATSRTGQQ